MKVGDYIESESIKESIDRIFYCFLGIMAVMMVGAVIYSII